MDTAWALLTVLLLATALFWAEVDMEVTRWRSRE